MGESQHLFAVTISAKRRPGMDEDAYHKYISEIHAGHLKHLLVKNKIVDYTMVGPDRSAGAAYSTQADKPGSNITRPD